MCEVHMIIFTLKNLFKDKKLLEFEKNYLEKEFFYHKKVVPMIKEYNKPIKDNKMFWDYFDLKKFSKFYKKYQKKNPNH